ncbi:preprotein translocase subunit SecY [Robiginitomaculum antarcticum]|uniref:preprotein translocase subunit SecY n=1 Tax=Robiginitomaculum antarcticum TaxID=437507 RepID=UPI0003759D08|nr:preprotein translocase subunit SecY [Robiginitomaculum antarcticum]
MASASEQLASNMNLGAFGKAKDLQQRILFTLFVLIIYRLGTFVPVPGINLAAYADTFASASGGLLDRANMFSGGAVERMAVFALNVMPYITASIVMQMMKKTVPSLVALDKDGGQQGRQQINQYTRYLTVFLALFQAYGIARLLEAQDVVINPGLFFQVTCVVTLVGGTMFLMWLGEQITARGVGNGVSLIIFAGIVAELPRAIYQTIGLGSSGQIPTSLVVVVLGMAIALTLLIVFVERAQRRLLVQYPKRQMAGGKQFGGQNSFLPLKINTAGVIPPIFASSLLLLPATAGQMLSGGGADGGDPGMLQTAMAFIGYGSPLYLTLYGVLVIFFCFFYTSFVFDSEQVADNLRKQGGFLPGIRPGVRTQQYLDYVLNRLTLIGALYVAFVCVLPEYLISQNQEIPPSVGMLIGGMSLLIIVSVTIDTVTQIQSHLIAHQYEGLIKKSKMRRRQR